MMQRTMAKSPRENRSLFEDEYRDEVTEYMHEMDSKTTASADLMDMQPELQWYMRPFLVDFLVEIHQQFRLRPEVLYLSLNIVDRYVSKRVVYKKHYQLVGCAALWIAAKFEDAKDRVPTVRELADMCCKAYDDSAFIQMEGHVLQTIGWAIGHPTAEAWMRSACMGNINEDTKTQHVARFVMEITLFHREFVGVKASIVAAGALMLARFICGLPRRAAQPQEEDILRVVQCLDTCFRNHSNEVSQIVVDKYAPGYYSRASTVVREWYSSGRQFIYTPIPTPASPANCMSSLSTPGLVPSWTRGGRYDFSSSPTGPYSCSSSEAGDELPRTPITPAHQVSVDPFLVSSTSIVSSVVSIKESKENIAPSHMPSAGQVYSFAGVNAHVVPVLGKGAIDNVVPMTAYAVPASRPVLHAIGHGQQQVMPRPLRRLSN